MTSIRYSRLEKCRSPRLDFQIQAIEPPSLEGLLVPHGNLVAYVLGGIESHGPTDRAGGSVIAVLGLLAILASAWLLGTDHHHGHGHGHGHDKHGVHDHGHADNNFRPANFHVLADALTLFLVITALLAGRDLRWAWMGTAMGLVCAIVIGRWARETAAVLVDVDADNDRNM